MFLHVHKIKHKHKNKKIWDKIIISKGVYIWRKTGKLIIFRVNKILFLYKKIIYDKNSLLIMVFASRMQCWWIWVRRRGIWIIIRNTEGPESNISLKLNHHNYFIIEDLKVYHQTAHHQIFILSILSCVIFI